MIEQVAENIFRIAVPLPNNPLRELNSYFIRGTERDLLIDTGFRRDECREALEEGLRELGSDASRRDVLITHLHSDHSGMADLFTDAKGKIYLSRPDLDYMHKYLQGITTAQKNRRFMSEGFPQEEIEYIESRNPARIYALPAIDNRFCGIEDGYVIDTGNYRLRTIIVPGHTPGNAVFWAEEQKILFSGDHVLFDITPNITAWSGVADSLGSYICGLQHVRDLPVKQTLPAHRKTGDFHARVDTLIEHHKFRLREALRIVTENPGMHAYDITGKMTWQIRARNWDDFPLVQKWFAVGECLSHLDFLRIRSMIDRRMKNGIWEYYRVENAEICDFLSK